jgi:hypothetical protein
MSAERNGSRRRNPYPQRPEIRFVRQAPGRWTLSDGQGVIEADAGTFVPVRR